MKAHLVIKGSQEPLGTRDQEDQPDFLVALDLVEELVSVDLQVKGVSLADLDRRVNKDQVDNQEVLALLVHQDRAEAVDLRVQQENEDPQDLPVDLAQ